MHSTLKKYIPLQAVGKVVKLLDHENLTVVIKNERKTRHGDYRQLRNGNHKITINFNLNSYRFLVTLIHEIAHLKAYTRYGYHIKPHGKEWKFTFQQLILPFLDAEIFPRPLLPYLAHYFKNPKASTDSDSNLSYALKQYDPPNGKKFIFEIPKGATFRLYNGRVFKMGDKRTKRYECIEIETGRLYLFNPNAEVDLLVEP